MNIKSIFTLSLSLCLITALAGCGSSSGGGGATANVPSNSAVAATSLVYTNNPAGAGNWRLEQDATSTKTHIVLNLIGADNLSVRGVGFNLLKGQCAVFGKFSNGGYAMDTGVFQLMGTNTSFESYAGTPADPVLFVSAPIKGGTVLSTGIFQKDRTNVPKAANQPLVQVAIDLDPAAAATPACAAGTVIALSIVKAKVIPADIGGMDFQLTTDVIAKAKMADVTIAVGALVTQ